MEAGDETEYYAGCLSTAKVKWVDIKSMTFTNRGLNYIRPWKSNYQLQFSMGVITHPCPNSDSDIAKSPLKLGHGCVITCHSFMNLWLIIHILNAMLVSLIRVSNRGHFLNTNMYVAARCSRVKERYADGVKVLFWYHWQHNVFILVV